MKAAKKTSSSSPPKEEAVRQTLRGDGCDTNSPNPLLLKRLRLPLQSQRYHLLHRRQCRWLQLP